MFNGKVKTALVLTWLAGLFICIGAFFWRYEVKYALPTPVPRQYHTVVNGTSVDLGKRFGVSFQGKPLFIHFFNPSCPCSRFNLKHVRSLIRTYHDRIDFAVVVLGDKDGFSKTDIIDELGMDLPVAFDSSIAADCGVYSTPQAVLLDAQHRLFYRGNYNRSRYCTDKKTDYAWMALDSFLKDPVSKPAFDQYALKAYGCSLPVCTK